MGSEKEDEEPENSDYVDLGFVDYEIADIKKVLAIKNTTKDKLTYTLFCLNIFFTCFLVGYLPEYFYIWHTVKAILLLSYRCYSYYKLHFQFFLVDFCYFTNTLILLYIWLPQALLPTQLRGALFTTCFSFANGPVLSAIVLWKNSLVPHSNDKMTSLFVHVSPALTMWTIRWFSSSDQHFPLCYHYTPDSSSSCDSTVDFMQIFIYPMLAYVAWQVFYIIMVEFIGYKKVYVEDYATSYTYLSRKKSSFLVQVFNIFGPSMAKPMFILWQFVYTLLILVVAYYCYFSKLLNIVAVTVAMTFAAYNGASFYIDVFSMKYQLSQKST